MHKNSYLKMEWFKNTYLDASQKLDILDVGSLDVKGGFNYKPIFSHEKWTYTGLDVKAGNNVDIVITDIYNWFEIEDNSYDVIISGQFFEHLEYFWLTMNQIERVLKPGGYVCIIAPSSGLKHGGDELNCYRFHKDGLKAMAKYVDLEIVNVSVDNRPEANPYNDACLVARKKGQTVNVVSESELENRVDSLESKLDTIINQLKD